MRRLTVFAILLIIAAQSHGQVRKPKASVEYLKKYNYKIEVEVTNAFSVYEIRYVLDNRLIDDADSSNSLGNTLKPLVFYIIDYSPNLSVENNAVVPLKRIDTTQVLFSELKSDSLFNLARKFIKSLQFNNVDTIVNGVVMKTVVSDDSRATISVEYEGVNIVATIESISNPSMGTKELNGLLNFIERQWVSNKG